LSGQFAQAGKAAIPVHLLLSHRAGLPAIDTPLPTDALYDWDTMTRALAVQEPWWEPGTQHGYHAFTFGWLVDRVRVLSPESIDRTCTEQANGPDAVLSGWPTRFGLGQPFARFLAARMIWVTV
jgi:CubicO group peptidase (beta-lactamase class C family)